MSKQRIFYIDNLRIFLIGLVVLHHLAITYGAPGGWYYNESEAGFPEIIPLAMFVATNQAFFMGMFFFISAFFVIPSLKRKGIGNFVKDRLVRLGIPTVIFYFLLSPFTVFIHEKYIDGENLTFLEVLKNGWGQGFGPMWFVEALILFTAVFLLLRMLKWKIKVAFPGTKTILLVAFLIGLVQFIIRIWLPVGWSMPFTNFQFPHFLQYIFFFSFGIIAWQNSWMESISGKFGRRWFLFAQLLIFIGFPALFVFGGAAENGIDKFMGGFTWQCFFYTIWEQLVGFTLIAGLFGIFKKQLNSQKKPARNLSASAYGVYVFHAPVLLGISALFLHWQPPQIVKFLVLAPIALFACFSVAWLAKQIPVVKKIL
jgi:peptidoglycan/LPS O-acetylase OafA/YrhL